MDCNILVIDDEPFIPESISRALHGDGFTVFTAHNSAEALAMLDRHPIDVVMSERGSGTKGADLFSEIAELYPRTQRVLISDAHDVRDAVQAVNEGRATRFLTRPWANDTLREIMLEARRVSIATQSLDEPVTGWMTRPAFIDRLDTALGASGAPIAVIVAEMQNAAAIFRGLSKEEARQVASDIEMRCTMHATMVVPIANLGSGLIGFAIQAGTSDDASTYKEVAVALERQITTANGSLIPEFRLGICRDVGIDCDADELVKNATIALDSRPRRQTQIYNPSLAARLHQRVTLEQDLYSAIQNDELFYLMQPAIGTSTLQAESVELLMRWEHPTQGVIAPLSFIDLAERNGLISDIGQWVISQGVRQIQVLDEIGLGHTRVSVNVSPRQFRDSDWIHHIERYVVDGVVDAHRLEIEITETAVLHNLRYARTALAELREIGVRVALDDFGSGNSSLAHLHDLPLDLVKLDRSLVRHIESEQTHQTVLRHVVQLANDLGLETVAEGVETDAELTFCRDIGCSRAQGFLLYPPMAPNELYRILHGDRSGVLH